MKIATLRVVAGGLACLASALLTHATQVPFALPWDDNSSGAVDLSSWNTPITESNRVGIDAEGHFVAAGSRVRFVGMNFAGDSPFTPTNKAEAVAGRLAKFGINCVRFHHMDASWAYGGGLIQYGAGNSRNLNPARLDQVLYLVSRLKAHGVYANLNLLVGREFKAADGLPADVDTMDWKDRHILGLFDDAALALHKEFATRLLTASNRYTGLTLAQDPAVAFVEIMNENGLLQKWYDGGLDRLPAVFATRLQARWNRWLAGQYADDQALSAAWHLIDQPLGTNLVRNGAFQSGFNYWTQEKHSGANASFTIANEFGGLPAARIQVLTPGTEGWHIQLNQPGVALTNGQLYTFSFNARASTNTSLEASVMQAHDPYSVAGYSRTLALTTNWQQFEATFQATVTDANTRPNFGGFAREPVTVSLADVRLQTGGQLGVLPAGISLAATNIPNVPFQDDQGRFTSEGRRDWLRFLLQLEQDYWATMKRHIRDVCGYPGLIFGTILANSPANVQAQLDVIDGHAYWQHPVFPGIPWDSVDWYEPNVSLVNTVGSDNTIAGLARQRVKGKPFTVTEYNHPSPNYYGAEGPLLLATYAALQDWDGLWFFDYGPGSDFQPMNFFRGFFDFGQHPTKMASVRLAAALFRRGDVRPANREYSMALSPERELDLLQRRSSAWNVASGSLLDVPGKLALVSRLSLGVGTNATGLTNPPAVTALNAVSSDTQELLWNLATTGRGVVTVNSPRTKAVIGFADNRTYDLGGIQLRPGTTQLGWCALGLSLNHGLSLTNAGSALLIACGQVDNPGMVWKDAQKNSVGNQWGGPTVLAESVPLTIVLPIPADRVQAWALDGRGQRKTPLTITSTNGAAVLDISTNAASLWFEIQVTAASAFDAWRTNHFNAAQLQDPAISGEDAAPARDHVQNLFKYSLGLSPWTPLDTPLLQPLTVASPQGARPALAIAQSKNSSDVEIVAEVSSDLVAWNSGPGVTEVVRTEDLGTAWRYTVADPTPLGTPDQRFLRLKAVRKP